MEKNFSPSRLALMIEVCSSSHGQNHDCGKICLGVEAKLLHCREFLVMNKNHERPANSTQTIKIQLTDDNCWTVAGVFFCCCDFRKKTIFLVKKLGFFSLFWVNGDTPYLDQKLPPLTGSDCYSSAGGTTTTQLGNY